MDDVRWTFWPRAAFLFWRTRKGSAARVLKPDVVVDAILAKKNLGTQITDAPLVIGVGPGFCAGRDCHAVIETMRGHYAGPRHPATGEPIPNTNIPGPHRRLRRGAGAAGPGRTACSISCWISARWSRRAMSRARLSGVPMIGARSRGCVRGMLAGRDACVQGHEVRRR